MGGLATDGGSAKGEGKKKTKENEKRVNKRMNLRAAAVVTRVVRYCRKSFEHDFQPVSWTRASSELERDLLNEKLKAYPEGSVDFLPAN